MTEAISGNRCRGRFPVSPAGHFITRRAGSAYISNRPKSRSFILVATGLFKLAALFDARFNCIC